MAGHYTCEVGIGKYLWTECKKYSLYMKKIDKQNLPTFERYHYRNEKLNHRLGYNIHNAYTWQIISIGEYFWNYKSMVKR